MTQVLTRERRACPSGDELTPAELVRVNVQTAQQQLAQARESLISARRRVSSLEKVVESWFEMAQLVRETEQHQLRSAPCGSHHSIS